jgi:hypothetical protein
MIESASGVSRSSLEEALIPLANARMLAPLAVMCYL